MKTAIEYPESKNPKVPEQIRPFYHSYPLQMRFNDIDMVGHLNNSIYLSFLDLGKIHYFKAVMGNQVSWEHIPVVVVNININFYSPTYLEEEIEVVTAVYAISEHSFKMEQRIINRQTGDIKCVANTVMAGFDPKTAKGAPIDPVWANAIKEFEGL
ncbi:MAG: acyl-CoA thioesterase [Bacteroides sp.]|nr:acyl-CoA thioesterase [Bacteroidales bacterium]MBD5379421.1 acyl-CoA thioesterase [Bacteroides sp.]